MATAMSAAIPAGQVGRQETLSEWAGPYVTSMLGKAQALSEQPYQVYQGPLTAGAAPLQMQAFQRAGGLGMPTDLTSAAQTAGGIASGMGMPTYTPIGGSFTDMGTAQQFMNPYMQQVLAPQLQQMQRQADIQRSALGAQAARAGAFGGARAGLMNAQLNADLMRQQQQAVGGAYGQAYTQGLGQYNIEQARRAQEAQFGAQFGLQGLAQRLAAAQAQGAMGAQQSDIARQNLASMLGAGQMQRDIEAQGIAADLAEFQQQRDYPYKMLQFQQSMLQGMPIQSIAAAYQQPTSLANTLNTMGGLMGLYEKLNPKKP